MVYDYMAIIRVMVDLLIYYLRRMIALLYVLHAEPINQGTLLNLNNN